MLQRSLDLGKEPEDDPDPREVHPDTMFDVGCANPGRAAPCGDQHNLYDQRRYPDAVRRRQWQHVHDVDVDQDQDCARGNPETPPDLPEWFLSGPRILEH